MEAINWRALPVRGVLAVAATALFLAVSPQIHAKAGGITGESGNPDAGNKLCTNCHSGGVAPDVTIAPVDGSPSMAAGTTKEFVLTITSLNPASQTHGGFNVSMQENPDTRAGYGTLGVSTDNFVQFDRGEITHINPKPMDANNQITFLYTWTAPVIAGQTAPLPVRMYGAGNNVNLDGSTNGDNATGTIFTITVNPVTENVPPVAVISAPPDGSVLPANVAISFSGQDSFDPNSAISSYAWDFGDGTTGNGVTTSHTYATDGIYTVTLTVTDDGEPNATPLSDTTSITLEITSQNIPPTADPNGPYTCIVTVPCTISGAGSSDTDGIIVTYDWDFGDGTSGAGEIANHTYSAVGTYTIALTVTDDGGAFATASTQATVTGAKDPFANPGGPYLAPAGVPVQFDATGSFGSQGIRNYLWDLGDGTRSIKATLPHAYLAAGNYSVSLLVIDYSFKYDKVWTTAIISSGAGAPVADASGPYTGVVNSPVTFDGSASVAAQGKSIVGWNWNFGDGTTGTGQFAQHTYTGSGLFSVTLTVTDDAGLISAPAVTSATINPTDTAEPELLNFNAPNRVRLSAGETVNADLVLDVNMISIPAGQQRLATAHIVGSNGLAMQQDVTLTAGSPLQVVFTHGFTAADGGVITWDAWVYIPSSNNESNHLGATTDVIVK